MPRSKKKASKKTSKKVSKRRTSKQVSKKSTTNKSRSSQKNGESSKRKEGRHVTTRRAIRRAQLSKKSMIPAATFARIARSIGGGIAHADPAFKGKLRFSKDALVKVQTHVEDRIVRFLKAANEIAVASNKKTLTAEHLRLTERVLNGKVC